MTNNVQPWIKALVLLTLFAALTGCAHHMAPEDIQDPYGLFSGIWHGLIFPLTVLVNIISWTISLFGPHLLFDIQIIGRPNTGFWYYVGFFVGFSNCGLIFGST